MMYYCHQELCEEESSTWVTHKQHLLMHKKAEVFGDIQPADQTTFLCEICFKVLGKEDEFALHGKFHERDLTSNSKGFICDVCGKGYSDKPGVKKHMEEKHPEYDPEYYKKYIQFLPGAVSPFQCRLC